MTDKEIIKSLECCSKELDVGCRECHYPRTYNANCGSKLMRDALDLINRQKEEIEKLRDRLATECMHSIEFRRNIIKEFAEGLKRKAYYVGGYAKLTVEVDGIDTLVKEMVGGANEQKTE